MPRISQFLFTFAAFLLVLPACRRTMSDELKQERIFCVYTLEYTAQEQRTYALAEFRVRNVRGALLELATPSSVQFGGVNMLWDSELRRYQRIQTARVDTGTFFWQDTDGATYANSASIENLQAEMPANFTQLRQSQAYTFAWEGAALQDGELIALTIQPVDNSSASAKIYKEISRAGATSFEISASEIAQLSPEAYRAQLTRTRARSAEEATEAGGSIQARYRTAWRNIEILP